MNNKLLINSNLFLSYLSAIMPNGISNNYLVKNAIPTKLIY